MYYRIEEKESVLDDISNVLAEQNNAYENYKPTLAVIITWFDSELFQSNIKVRINLCMHLHCMEL